MGLINYMREKIRSFLKIESVNNSSIVIQQKLDYCGNAVKNRIWYCGDSQELSQLYGQLDAPVTMFWKATSTKGLEIRKIHTGLPKLIVNVLTNIVNNDYNGVEIKQPTLSDEWIKIEKKNKISKLIKACVKNILVVGDGAFKITFDKTVSEDCPLIEFVQGEYIDFIYKRGQVVEIVFSTEYHHNGRKYVFKENYGYGYIKYSLVDENGKVYPNNFIPQTEWVKGDGVSFDKEVILAVPTIFGESEQYPGRGESIFDGKTDSFDAFDEAWSQWMDALRAGRTTKYIPECFIPRNPETGELLTTPNSFDNRFISVESDMSESRSGNKIYTESTTIQHDSYLSTYITALDLCLQGIISPSTLGIDVKKLDNGVAQREKEKTTLYTRGNIIEVLNDVLPELVITAVCAKQIWEKKKIEKPVVTVKFGEYANPSFESQVETIGKARREGLMSVETSVDELYGDTKDSDWKKEETKKIKIEQGIETVEENSLVQDVEV